MSWSTFDRLEVFRQSMLWIKRQPPIFLLAGNKSDKTDEQEVAKDEGIALARSFGCSFMEMSARTTHNVEVLFANLVWILRNSQQGLETTLVASPQRQWEEKKWSKMCFICWWTIVCIFFSFFRPLDAQFSGLIYALCNSGPSVSAPCNWGHLNLQIGAA